MAEIVEPVVEGNLTDMLLAVADLAKIAAFLLALGLLTIASALVDALFFWTDVKLPLIGRPFAFIKRDAGNAINRAIGAVQKGLESALASFLSGLVGSLELLAGLVMLLGVGIYDALKLLWHTALPTRVVEITRTTTVTATNALAKAQTLERQAAADLAKVEADIRVARAEAASAAARAQTAAATHAGAVGDQTLRSAHTYTDAQTAAARTQAERYADQAVSTLRHAEDAAIAHASRTLTDAIRAAEVATSRAEAGARAASAAAATHAATAATAASHAAASATTAAEVAARAARTAADRVRSELATSVARSASDAADAASHAAASATDAAASAARAHDSAAVHAGGTTVVQNVTNVVQNVTNAVTNVSNVTQVLGGVDADTLARVQAANEAAAAALAQAQAAAADASAAIAGLGAAVAGAQSTYATRAALATVAGVADSAEHGLNDLIGPLGLSGAAALIAAIPAISTLVHSIASEAGLDTSECRGKVRGICGTDVGAWSRMLAGLVPIAAAFSFREVVAAARDLERPAVSLLAQVGR